VRLRAEQLEAHLAKSLSGIYLIHGDEPLLALEAADAVRAAARRRGHSVREVLYVERGFDWSAFRQAAGSGSLFGDKSIIELRFATGRVAAPAAQALVDYCERPNPDALLLVSMPRPEGSGWWKAGWFTALEGAGMVVEVAPVAREALPAWIDARLRRQRQQADRDTLAFLADRVEGNLLAAQQEILKLALLAPEGALAPEAVKAAVTSVARYDFDALAEALYRGDFARYARILAGLRGEGESAAGLAWRLGEELTALARIQREVKGGARLESLFAALRIWRGAQPRYEAALRRLDAARLRRAVVHMARIERAAKGAGDEEPWDEFLTLGLELQHGAEGPRQVA
jgi:DNA polymerase-3 subunit delta